MGEGLSSPIFLKYLEIYEKTPHSRVFAPLAEHYRQVGMIEKAIDILKRGIKVHPSYVMGHLGLAFCYFDQRQFNLAYNILKPLIPSNRDNMRLQRLFAKTCLEIGKYEDALDVFKYILFISPRDHETQEMVKHLEKGELAKVLKPHEPVLFEDDERRPPSAEEMRRTFELENINVDPAQDHSIDGWRRVDLTKMVKAAALQEEKRLREVKPQTFKPETKTEFLEKNLGSMAPPVIHHSPVEKKTEGEAPFMTHTLVDLYCSQGHVNKAIEILEKMLELNPDDERTVQKLQEVTRLLSSSQELGFSKTDIAKDKILVKGIFEEEFVEEEKTPEVRKFTMPELTPENKIEEEKGRQDLLNMLDQKLKKGPSLYLDEVEHKMNDFLFALKKKASEHKKTT